MTSLTVKNIPDSLYRVLKETAARNNRSLNREIIARLEQSVGAAPMDPEALLVRARSVRERAALPFLSDRGLRAAKDEGRS